MISNQSINMSVIKTLLKVTNNFISLCQSRVLRIPAVSTGQCPLENGQWWGIENFSCHRWGIFAASLKLWNGNQKNYQWPPSWWVNNNILSHQQSNFKAKIYKFTKTFHREVNTVVMDTMSVQDQCPMLQNESSFIRSRSDLCNEISSWLKIFPSLLLLIVALKNRSHLMDTVIWSNFNLFLIEDNSVFAVHCTEGEGSLDTDVWCICIFYHQMD